MLLLVDSASAAVATAAAMVVLAQKTAGSKIFARLRRAVHACVHVMCAACVLLVLWSACQGPARGLREARNGRNGRRLHDLGGRKGVKRGQKNIIAPIERSRRGLSSGTFRAVFFDHLRLFRRVRRRCATTCRAPIGVRVTSVFPLRVPVAADVTQDSTT